MVVPATIVASVNLCVRRATNFKEDKHPGAGRAEDFIVHRSHCGMQHRGRNAGDATASVARLASAEDQPAGVAPTSVVVVKPDEVRNERPRKKPRMVLRCALFGPYIQGCNAD